MRSRARAHATMRHPSARQLDLLWHNPDHRRRGRGRRHRSRRAWPRVAGVVVAGAALVVVAGWTVTSSVEIDIDGLEDGAVLDADEASQLEVGIDVGGFGAGGVDVLLNGSTITADGDGGSLVVRPGALLRDGTNVLEVRVGGRMLFDDHSVTRRFEARLQRALLSTPPAVLRPSDGRPIVVRGLVDDAVALLVDQQPVEMRGGMFEIAVPTETERLTVTAVHANGNAERQTITVVDEVPPVEFPETRAVHITARAWADPVLRGAVLDLAATGRINAVELDIKDETGEIGYRSEVGLANEAGSVREHYDVDGALAELDALGVRVIGRIVCFLDPTVARWAWDHGRHDMVVQSADGTAPLASDYGPVAFTNFASGDVQAMLVALAVEAADAGFDEILYDYVRRPEGPIESMTIPGLTREPAAEIARFVRETRSALEPFDVELGISVFGISASRPDPVAQDIRLLAPNVDYISPMVYPSHWGAGEYGVDDPLRQPAAIVERSLADFRDIAAGSGAAIVPWLQAFSTGSVTYGPAEVQAQIDAARGVGSRGYLLWNANSVYEMAPALPNP